MFTVWRKGELDIWKGMQGASHSRGGLVQAADGKQAARSGCWQGCQVVVVEQSQSMRSVLKRGLLGVGYFWLEVFTLKSRC